MGLDFGGRENTYIKHRYLHRSTCMSIRQSGSLQSPFIIKQYPSCLFLRWEGFCSSQHQLKQFSQCLLHNRLKACYRCAQKPKGPAFFFHHEGPVDGHRSRLHDTTFSEPTHESAGIPFHMQLFRNKKKHQVSSGWTCQQRDRQLPLKTRRRCKGERKLVSTVKKSKVVFLLKALMFSVLETDN